jgi:hypothetical protein
VLVLECERNDVINEVVLVFLLFRIKQKIETVTTTNKTLQNRQFIGHWYKRERSSQ